MFGAGRYDNLHGDEDILEAEAQAMLDEYELLHQSDYKYTDEWLGITDED